MKSENPALVSLLIRGMVSVAVFLQIGCGSNTPSKPEPAVKTDTASSTANSTETAETTSDKTKREPADSHEQMLDLLKKIAFDTKDTNPYLGDLAVRKAQAQLEGLRPGQVQEELGIRTLLGFELLRSGRNDDAISQLEKAVQMVMGGRASSSMEATETLVLLTALSWLRKAEVANCAGSKVPEVCIFPLTAEGVHTDKVPAQKAMRYLLMLLERRPQNRTARWLLNIAAMSIGEYPDGVPEQFRISVNRFDGIAPLARFNNVAATAGVDVMSLSGGMIADDFNNDGHIDLMMSDCHPASQIRLFRNNGNGSFTDITEESGLMGITGGLNIIQADYNNDGWLDVLVLRGGWLPETGRYPNSLLKNNGPAGFRDVAIDVGLAAAQEVWPNAPTQTASWGDMDLDGDLDLCVGNENAPLQLYRNDGDKGFIDIAESLGVNTTRFIKGVIWGDYDHDGDPDFYASCLDGPNLLFRNELTEDGELSFVEVAEQMKVQKPERSFATWFWDYDNDGHLDLFVTSYAASIEDIAADYANEETPVERMRLYKGNGGGEFSDVTVPMGLYRVSQPMGSNFGDLDHDGYLDFYLGTGDIPYQALMPNLMFYNHRGQGFADVTNLTSTGHLQKGHGVAFADFDEDGDQDLAVEVGGAFAGDRFQNALFQNPGSENHWITIQLQGVSSNRSAIGARLKLTVTEGGAQRTIHRHVNSGGTFGGNPLQQQIGIGAATSVDELQIEWPNRQRSFETFFDVAAERTVRIIEGQNRVESLR